jgi:DNA-binding MurR/RpiR family transcriptional regulator
LVIAISFPRYAEDVVKLLRQLREKKVPILALTDAASSPLASLANLTLYAQTRRQFSPNSEGAALCLIEALCNAVAHQAKSPVHSASEMAEFVMPWVYQEGSTPRKHAELEHKGAKRNGKRSEKIGNKA